MRRAQHYNKTAAAVITIFILSTFLFSTSTAQTTSLRCQKSGCREGETTTTTNNNIESSPTLIVTKPKSNAFPTLIPYITAFLLLRLGFRYIKKILPMLRDRMEILWSEFRLLMSHYYHDYILNDTNSHSRRKRGGSRRGGSRSVVSNLSLGSLAEFVDYGDDNDSYSTKSGYSTETGTSVGLSELLSDNDTTTITTEAFNSRRGLAGRRRGSVGSFMNSVASSAGKEDEEDASTIGGTTISSSRGSILSKFLNYITESSPRGTDTSSRHDQMTQRERNDIISGAQHNAHPKRRSSIDYSVFSSSNNVKSNDIEKQQSYKHGNYYSRSNNGNNHQLEEPTTRQRPRRSTVDDSFNHQRSTSAYLTSHHNVVTKGASSNANANNSGIKVKKNAMVTSAEVKQKSYKVHQLQQQSTKKQQVQQQLSHSDNNGDEEDKQKKKPSLHHHLSKFASSSSSSKKNDDENYSTMMSTVDLRTRASFATGLSTK